MFFDTKAIAREKREKELNDILNEFDKLGAPVTLGKLLGPRPNDTKKDACPIFKKQISDPILKDKLKQYLSNDSMEITQFAFIDAMMHLWFQTEIKISGHSLDHEKEKELLNHYVLFSRQLAAEMLKRNLEKFSSKDQAIWDKFILNKNGEFKEQETFKSCLKACPLKKTENSYEFIHPSIKIHYEVLESTAQIKSKKTGDILEKLKQRRK